MATVKLILWKSDERKNGTCPLKIRVTNGNKQRYINLKQYVLKHDWDTKTQRVKNTDTNYKSINKIIKARLKEFQEKVSEETNQTITNRIIKIKDVQPKQKIKSHEVKMIHEGELVKELLRKSKNPKLRQEDLAKHLKISRAYVISSFKKEIWPDEFRKAKATGVRKATEEFIGFKFSDHIIKESDIQNTSECDSLRKENANLKQEVFELQRKLITLMEKLLLH